MSHTVARTLAVLALLCCSRHLSAQVTIQEIEVNQGIGVQKDGALKFVAGKDAVVRAFLGTETTVDAGNTSVVITRDGERVATIAPNDYDLPTRIVDFQCSNRESCGKWAAGSYTFAVKVNGQTKSTAGTSYVFRERGSLRVLVVPVKANYGGRIVEVTDNRWKTFGDYIRNVFPIAPDKFDWQVRENELDATDDEYDLHTSDGQRKVWEALVKLRPAGCDENPLADGCSHLVVGIIQERAGKEGNLQGYTFGLPAAIGVAKDEDCAATLAHEIGHVFDMGDTYDGGSFNCDVNPSPDEFKGTDFKTDQKIDGCSKGRRALQDVAGTLVPAEHHPYEIGGRGALGDSAEYSGSGGKQAQFWASQDTWDWLFDKLVPPPAADSLESSARASATSARYIQVFGQLRENASKPEDVTVDPWWPYEDNENVETATGKYMVVAVGETGTRLASQKLNVDFTPFPPKGLPATRILSAPFGEEMLFPTGTAKFQILNDGAVIKEIPVTRNTPTVRNVAPQLIATVNGTIAITWDAVDADNDRLSYEIEYNPDVTNPESEWQILARDFDEKRLEIDFDDMGGGPHAKVRVSANDGINLGTAESLEFIVAPKAPEVFIDSPVEGGIFPPGKEVVLDGEAFDLQDDDIDTSQFVWSSDRSGVLGTGSPLKVMNLPAGRHVITLSVTNSLGLRGSSSAQILVGTLSRRRAARR
ncbi:MAG TPA: hypothetical protein VNM92_17705 [Thermoanaerobaculia bacterium]|nr:hypothetical protein [Thermoanaerobaculia bacterium]